MPKQAKLEVQDLILEITRNCSMQCPHCLRGDREPVNMPDTLIRNIFSNVSAIDCLTFTGGEPGCNPAGILAALKYAKRYRTKVRRIWLATNGLHADAKFLGALRNWHEYCLSCEFPMPDMTSGTDAIRFLRAVLDDHECRPGLSVAISLDAYHDDIPSRNLLKLMTLPQVTLDKCREADDFKWIMNQGLANWNGIAPENSPADNAPWAYGPDARIPEIEVLGPGGYKAEQLYINVHGRILKHCDYAYDDQDEYALDARISVDKTDRDWAGWLVRTAMSQNRGDARP